MSRLAAVSAIVPDGGSVPPFSCRSDASSARSSGPGRAGAVCSRTSMPLRLQRVERSTVRSLGDVTMVSGFGQPMSRTEVGRPPCPSVPKLVPPTTPAQVIRGTLNYCIACFRRGSHWWRTNKMTQRLEFRYIQDIQDEDDVDEWEDCVSFLLSLAEGCDSLAWRCLTTQDVPRYARISNLDPVSG